MSSPTRPKLLPNTSHQSTRYEVDIYLDGQWLLRHMRKDLVRAKAARAALLIRNPTQTTRLVAVTETRRVIS